MYQYLNSSHHRYRFRLQKRSPRRQDDEDAVVGHCWPREISEFDPQLYSGLPSSPHCLRSHQLRKLWQCFQVGRFRKGASRRWCSSRRGRQQTRPHRRHKDTTWCSNTKIPRYGNQVLWAFSQNRRKRVKNVPRALCSTHAMLGDKSASWNSAKQSGHECEDGKIGSLEEVSKI